MAGAASLVLLAGCGSTPGVSPPVAHAGRVSGLGEARFARLDAIYLAAVPLDAVQRAAAAPATLQSKARVVDASVLAACRGLDPHDVLLGPLRRACVATFSPPPRVACPAAPPPLPPRAGLNVFSGGVSCPARYQAVRAGLARLMLAETAADRAVAAAALTPACKAALVRPAAVHPLERTIDALYALFQAGAVSSAHGNTAFTAYQDEIVKLERALPTNAEQLGRFRAGCA